MIRFARNLTINLLAVAALLALCALRAPHVEHAWPVAAGSPVDLVQRHHCWTQTAPAGVIPGHVVAQLDSGRVVYGGRALTGKALAQLFDGHDHGLTVFAFCR